MTTLFPLLLAVAPQANDAHILLREDQILSNGARVEFFTRFDVTDQGRWAAAVGTDAPGVGTAGGQALVVDGQVVLQQGDVLSHGEQVSLIRRPEIDPTGSLAVLIETPDPAGGHHQCLVVDGTVVLATGPTPIPATLPGGYALEQILEFRRWGNELVVEVDFVGPITGDNVMRVRLGTDPAGLPVVQQAQVQAEAGQLFAPVGHTMISANGIAFATDSEAGIVGRADVAGVDSFFVTLGSTLLALDGDPCPVPGFEWDATLQPQLAVASGGAHVFTSAVKDSTSGSSRSVVVRNGSIVFSDGDPIPGTANTRFGDLESSPLALSDSGRSWGVFETASGGQVLMADGSVRLRSGASLASGVGIADVGDSWQTFEASPDGRRCALEVELAGGHLAFVVVERDLGAPTMCTSAPNSTGVFGGLRFDGSSLVAANDLLATAFDLPQNSFGYLNTSQAPGFVANPGGAVGNLCISGAIGRFVGQVQSSGTEGSIATTVDLTAIPQPTGAVMAAVGDTWYFQLWHRDSSPTGPVSNWTLARSLTLR